MKVGAVAIIGRPNVGKSTLVNLLCGHKVSIVSNKPQTTRYQVRGILTVPEYQLVFVDTPGIHEQTTALGKKMNESAKGALASVDLVVYVADVSRPPSKEDQDIAHLLKRAWHYPYAEENPGFNGVILCLNKMDKLKAEFVVENVEAYCKLFETENYMLTAMNRGHNSGPLLERIVERLPEGEMLYPDDEYTDQPMRRLAAELVREKALAYTRQEVPHGLATIVDAWDDQEGGNTRIFISIIVEREGQKAILIGRGGSMLKKIGTEARKDIEDITGRPVFLELFVKVREDWRQNPRMLNDLGLA